MVSRFFAVGERIVLVVVERTRLRCLIEFSVDWRCQFFAWRFLLLSERSKKLVPIESC